MQQEHIPHQYTTNGHLCLVAKKRVYSVRRSRQRDKQPENEPVPFKNEHMVTFLALIHGAILER